MKHNCEEKPTGLSETQHSEFIIQYYLRRRPELWETMASLLPAVDDFQSKVKTPACLTGG